MDHIMYNQKMMGFLFQQMQNLLGILESICEDPIFESEGQSWEESCNKFQKALTLGVKLIESSSKSFDLQEFYNAPMSISQFFKSPFSFLSHKSCQSVHKHISDAPGASQSDALVVAVLMLLMPH